MSLNQFNKIKSKRISAHDRDLRLISPPLKKFRKEFINESPLTPARLEVAEILIVIVNI